MITADTSPIVSLEHIKTTLISSISFPSWYGRHKFSEPTVIISNTKWLALRILNCTMSLFQNSSVRLSERRQDKMYFICSLPWCFCVYWLYEQFCRCAGLLWQVLSELSALHARATQDSGTQVDLTRSGPVTSLGNTAFCVFLFGVKVDLVLAAYMVQGHRVAVMLTSVPFTMEWSRSCVDHSYELISVCLSVSLPLYVCLFLSVYQSAQYTTPHPLVSCSPPFCCYLTY